MAVRVADGLSNSERTAAKLGMWPPMWHTPTGQDAKGSDWSSDGKGGKILKLQGQVREAMWPTPRSEDGESTGMSAARSETRTPDNLPTAVKLWPTPNTVDAKGGTRSGSGQNQLCHVVQSASRLSRPPTSGDQLPNAVGGVLNPEWVEKLMGIPPGWTDLGDWKPARLSRGKATPPAP